jgi:DNA-binding NtrC family response regulator
MPPAVQVKLLRVLESGTCMRVGSTTPIETDVRVVAATNRDPAQAVASGSLREDLMYRLNVFPIELPPLSRRREDLPLLVAHFLREISAREGGAKHASPQALKRLADYGWPGNVRELRNVLQRAYVMTAGSEIADSWLPRNELASPPPMRGASSALQIAIGTPLAAAERQLILATLEHFGHHKERTAAALGVSLKTLYNRLKEYGI